MDFEKHNLNYLSKNKNAIGQGMQRDKLLVSSTVSYSLLQFSYVDIWLRYVKLR